MSAQPAFPEDLPADEWAATPPAVRALVLALSQQVKTLAELNRDSEQLYRDLFELQSDALFIVRNSDGAILEANSAATTLYGYSYAEFTGLSNTDLSAEPESTRKATNSPAPVTEVVKIPLRWHCKKDGTVFPVEITARFIDWKGERVHLAAIRDITERRANEAQLELLATTDPLTGLFNRRHFFIEAQAIFDRASYPPYELAMLMLDLDNFKQVNDTYGHPAGDAVLQEVARRIQARLRPADLLGRYGGEEFVAILTRLSCAEASQVAERLLTAISELPMLVAAQAIPVTISIGLAWMEESTRGIYELVARADHALYLAKHAGRNRVVMLAPPCPLGTSGPA